MKHIIRLGESALRVLMRVPHPAVRWLARSLMRRDDDPEREASDHDHRGDDDHTGGVGVLMGAAHLIVYYPSYKRDRPPWRAGGTFDQQRQHDVAEPVKDVPRSG